MRLLTIHQPWAWLIVTGHKRYENRVWSTSYRGPLLIHAGMSTESLTRGKQLCQNLGIILPKFFDYGAILGVVNFHDCTTAEKISDPFASGPFCFHLTDPKKFVKPIPWRGALGLIEPAKELLDLLG